MLRYLPVPVTVRFEGQRLVELIRIVAAGTRVDAPVTVSAAATSPNLARYLDAVGVAHHVEDAKAWSMRAAALSAGTGTRIRLVEGSVRTVAEATGGSPAVAIYAGDVLSAGRVELLTFLREQAVSMAAHRFGMPRRREVPSRARTAAT